MPLRNLLPSSFLKSTTDITQTEQYTQTSILLFADRIMLSYMVDTLLVLKLKANFD